MRSHRSVYSAILLCLLAAPAVMHAGGFQLNEHGARALAQGGAFAARASDPSALFFNPAGLSFQQGFQFMAGATMIAPTYRFYGPTNLNMNEEWKMNSNQFFPPNVYVTNTWNDGMLKGLAVGLGLTTPYGLGTEWPDSWVGKAITREIDLKTFYVMPTVSYAVNDMISIGVGANVVFSSVKMRKAVTNFDPTMDLELTGDGDLAYSWNAGVIFRPTEKLSFGVSYRSQTDITFTGTADFLVNGAKLTGDLATMFPGGDVKTGLNTPATYFIGVAYMPSENLELEFDYQGINWSSYDKLTIDFVKDNLNTSGVAQSDVTSAKNYKNTFILRAGGEYKLPVLGLKLRAGYFYDANPVPDEHLEPLLPDSDRHGLNIGIGMKVLPTVTLDLAYTHMFISDRKTTKTSQPGGVYLDGLYQGSVEMIGANLTYAF